jgi:hypothetical protein
VDRAVGRLRADLEEVVYATTPARESGRRQ